MTFETIEEAISRKGTLTISNSDDGIKARMYRDNNFNAPITGEPSQWGILDAILKLEDALKDEAALKGLEHKAG